MCHATGPLEERVLEFLEGALWGGAGLRLNLADERQAPLFTLGVGMHLAGVRLDVAVGLSRIDTSGEADTYFSAAGAVGFSL